MAPLRAPQSPASSAPPAVETEDDGASLPDEGDHSDRDALLALSDEEYLTYRARVTARLPNPHRRHV